MDELAHGSAGDGFAVLAIGFQTRTEGADGRVVLPGNKRRVHSMHHKWHNELGIGVRNGNGA